MSAFGPTSAPVASCGVLGFPEASSSYNFIYSRFASGYGRRGPSTQCPAPTTSPAWRPARCLVFRGASAPLSTNTHASLKIFGFVGRVGRNWQPSPAAQRTWGSSAFSVSQADGFSNFRQLFRPIQGNTSAAALPGRNRGVGMFSSPSLNTSARTRADRVTARTLSNRERNRIESLMWPSKKQRCS